MMMIHYEDDGDYGDDDGDDDDDDSNDDSNDDVDDDDDDGGDGDGEWLMDHKNDRHGELPPEKMRHQPKR